MAKYVRLTHEQLPNDLPQHNPVATGEALTKLTRLTIAGFVTRGANVQHAIGELPDISIDSSYVALGACVSVMTLQRGRSHKPDIGPHRDHYKRWNTPGVYPLNSHTTGQGSAEVSVIMARPEANATDLPLDNNDAPTPDHIDSELFVPVCYHTQVKPGDTFWMIADRTLHDFTTNPASGPRTYSSGIYPIYLQTPDH